MTQITLRSEGADKIRVGLNRYLTTIQRVTKAIVRKTARKAMRRSVPYTGGRSYAVPVRDYKRTGNLGRSTFVIEDGLSFRIESNAVNDRGKPYSTFVIGKADGSGQAKIHDGWWIPLATAVNEELAPLIAELDDELQKSAEAVGL